MPLPGVGREARLQDDRHQNHPRQPCTAITCRRDAIVKEMTGGATVMAMEQDVAALKGMKAPSGKRIRLTASSRTASR